jgi:hypothetical protein
MKNICGCVVQTASQHSHAPYPPSSSSTCSSHATTPAAQQAQPPARALPHSSKLREPLPEGNALGDEGTSVFRARAASATITGTPGPEGIGDRC